MKIKWKRFLAFVVLTVMFCAGSMAVSAEDTISVGVTGTYGQTEARSMLKMINDFRTGPEAWYWNADDTTKTVYSSANGNALSPLAYDYDLEKAAMLRAMEIAVSYSHTRPSGGKAWTLFEWRTAGENIAAGYRTAASVFEGWQETNDNYSGQGHRRNMLSPEFTAVGIGHVYFNGYHYWVQVFRSPTGSTAVTPANDSETTVAVDILPSVIQSFSVTSDTSSLTLPYGGTAALPEAISMIGTADTWPFQYAPVTLPYEWTVGSGGCISIASGKISGNKVGTATLSTTIRGNTLTIPVTVTPLSVSPAVVSLSDVSYTYDGNAKTPAVSSVTLGGKLLSSGTDYSVSWSNNVKAGTATVTITGKGNYTGTVTKNFTIAAVDLSKGTVGSIADQQYTGKALKPSVTVKLSSNTLKKDTDYSVTYAKNTKVGTATVTVKGKGNYTGTLKKTFKIVEPTTPAKGKVVTDQKTGASYKITKAGTSKTATVEYRKPTRSKATVTIPDTVVINNVTCKVTSVAVSAFKNDKKVKMVTVGKNVTSIGKHAFYGCTKLQKVTAGSKVASIGDGAFYGCTKLSSLSLGSKVSSIGAKAFARCTALKKVTIPASVTRIGSQAFYGCKNLKSITIKTTKLTTKKVGSKAFSGTYSKATVKVPGSKVSAYRKLLKARGISAKAAVTK